MPLVLFAAKGDHIDRARKGIGLAGSLVPELNPHGMGILLIFINDHQCPLTIGPLEGICSHQRMTSWICNICGDWVHGVFAIPRLHPFQVDELAGKILIGWLVNLIVDDID